MRGYPPQRPAPSLDVQGRLAPFWRWVSELVWRLEHGVERARDLVRIDVEAVVDDVRGQQFAIAIRQITTAKRIRIARRPATTRIGEQGLVGRARRQTREHDRELVWRLEHGFERARADARPEEDTRVRIFLIMIVFCSD